MAYEIRYSYTTEDGSGIMSGPYESLALATAALRSLGIKRVITSTGALGGIIAGDDEVTYYIRGY